MKAIITVDETLPILRDSLGMKISNVTLRNGLRARVFPFGDCVPGEKHDVFYVYTRKLEQWITERKIEKTTREKASLSS